MQITFLGTGTSQGVPLIACQCIVCQSTDLRDKRLRSSILVRHNGSNIVVDSGPDFRQQMLTAGLLKLDGLVFTHAHKDHLAGFDDIRGFNFAMKKPVDVYCTDIVEKQMRQEFHYIFSEFRYPGIPDVTLHRINSEDPFIINDLTIVPIEVKHYKLPVLGFRFNDFVYITDANFISDESMKKIAGCDTFVLNALRIEEHISHFSLQQALDIISKVNPRRAFLTHISHQLGLHKEVSANLPENVFLAYDNLTIDC
jgi:phosphoribosyl 1,2-cyclic phosphate phosphodiesterase